MICPNCQKETPSNGNCCAYCGAVINTNGQSIPTVDTNTPQPQKKKGGIGKIFAIIFVAIVVAGIILALVPSGPTGSSVFEMTDSEGITSRTELHYENDVVFRMVDEATMPLPEGTTDTDIDMLKASFDLQKVEYTKHDCCSFTYDFSNNAVTIRITYTDLDDIENVKALLNDGLIEMDGTPALISFKETEKNLIAEGFKKISDSNE
ncbi:MAG: DUF1307 domain-containing protein [Ruminococcaceae bacterium]|nr:DUF1307 domain-containing protein [Oscillospiraceae bacterium]